MGDPFGRSVGGGFDTCPEGDGVFERRHCGIDQLLGQRSGARALHLLALSAQ